MSDPKDHHDSPDKIGELFENMICFFREVENCFTKDIKTFSRNYSHSQKTDLEKQQLVKECNQKLQKISEFLEEFDKENQKQREEMENPKKEENPKEIQKKEEDKLKKEEFFKLQISQISDLTNSQWDWELSSTIHNIIIKSYDVLKKIEIFVPTALKRKDLYKSRIASCVKLIFLVIQDNLGLEFNKTQLEKPQTQDKTKYLEKIEEKFKKLEELTSKITSTFLEEIKKSNNEFEALQEKNKDIRAYSKKIQEKRKLILEVFDLFRESQQHSLKFRKLYTDILLEQEKIFSISNISTRSIESAAKLSKLFSDSLELSKKELEIVDKIMKFESRSKKFSDVFQLTTKIYEILNQANELCLRILISRNEVVLNFDENSNSNPSEEKQTLCNTMDLKCMQVKNLIDNWMDSCPKTIIEKLLENPPRDSSNSRKIFYDPKAISKGKDLLPAKPNPKNEELEFKKFEETEEKKIQDLKKQEQDLAQKIKTALEKIKNKETAIETMKEMHLEKEKKKKESQLLANQRKRNYSTEFSPDNTSSSSSSKRIKRSSESESFHQNFDDNRRSGSYHDWD